MEFPTSSRRGSASGRAGPSAPPTITCIDCGGTAHLLTTFPPDDPPRGGDQLAYRCGDCGDRWDVIIDDDDLH